MLCGERILVVEDEALVSLLVEDELLEAGARIVGPAASVREALQLVETATTDGGLSGAVLDIMLADEEVRPVAERLAALGVPFVFATGYSHDDVRDLHTTAPVLHKPFDPRALVAALESLTSASG
jgi:DNA-binding response OmpR family regulator